MGDDFVRFYKDESRREWWGSEKYTGGFKGYREVHGPMLSRG